ncbi:MAG: CtsR family transcriptional regulator [Clostridia bacterium]|nr:CtsR family transcriptional regulator [Oscillospiraceae bacterium]MBQ2746678.1 CtsR family transcriptional regulator [Clostridia bacterium]
MRMSDLITERIIQMLEESSDNVAEIQRNEFAALMGCVPSQINYVLSSRFTPEHGYIIDSRRGGGGYIKISRVKLSRSSALMHIVNSIGVGIDSMSARIVVENCLQSGMISLDTAKLLQSAVSDSVMRTIPPEYRDYMRASLLKQMLLTQI